MAFSEKTKGEKKMIPDPFHEFPEFDVQDWSRLNLKNIPNRRIIGFINTCLQDREFRSLMMHQYGSLVLSASRNLLTRTQKELMEPLSYLMMVVKGNGRCLDLETDWRKIKQSQRARILREYWERLRKRKNLMSTLAQAYTRGRADPNHIQQSNQNPNLLTVFTEHFSAKGRDVREYNDHLNDIIKRGLSRLLPWRQILMHQIQNGNTSFAQLTNNTETEIIPNTRQDITFKFQFLMELAHNQDITLTQNKTFGKISIQPGRDQTRYDPANSIIKIRDDSGDTCSLDWQDLTPPQRSKVIQDLQDSKIILM